MNCKIIKYIVILLISIFFKSNFLYSQHIKNIPAEIPEHLFIIAKESILSQLKTNQQKSFVYIECSNDERGIFIRLINKKRERGCTGFYKGVSSFEQAAKVAGVNTAFFDERYKPISIEELTKLTIEITIIGRLEQIINYNDFSLGKHTIYIVGKYGKAIIQAQITTEKGWGKEDYLKAICRKANIDESSYKKPETIIYRADTIFKSREFKEIKIDK